MSFAVLMAEPIACIGLVLCKRAWAFMKFTIEIVRSVTGGREDVLHRTTVDEISPKRAKGKADQLLSGWRGRGASGARILNHQGEELYRAKAT